MPRVRSETKHFQAELRLREWINTLTPGDVLPVVCDLTERFNSSHGTIIRALTALADEGLIVRPLGKKRYLIAELPADDIRNGFCAAAGAEVKNRVFHCLFPFLFLYANF